MERTRFIRLDNGWNAEPNAPDPRVRLDGSDLFVTFLLNSFMFSGVSEDDVGVIRFHSCWRYRLGDVNDQGWYNGQCRFSGSAPEWGHFYEVVGDIRDGMVTDWVGMGDAVPDSRHFLFYFRDATFECDADGWSFAVEPHGAHKYGHLV